MSNLFWKLSSTGSFKTNLSFKNIEITTEKGLFSEYYETINFFSVDQINNLESELNPDIIDNLAGVLNVFPSFKNEIYSRSYLQIAEIAAGVIGIFKILMLIGNFITIIPYEFHFYEGIINEILNFDYKELH